MAGPAQDPEQQGIESRPALAHERFAAYLRSLRRERRLSLRQVEKLSEAFPDRVPNSYLAYCETGRFLPSLGKLITLSKVLGVPLQSFTERLEIDREAAASPEPAGATWKELRAAGIQEAEAGRLQRAYAHFERALSLARQGPARADLMMDMAIVLKRSSRHYTARDLLEEVLSRRELDAARLDRALILLGDVLREMGKLLIAATIGREAMHRAAAAGDRAKEAHAACLLANALFDMGSHQEAIPLYEKAVRFFRERGDSASLVCNLANLANCHVRDAGRGRFLHGIRLLQEARAIARQEGFRRQIADILGYLGQAYSLRGDVPRSERCFLRSSRIARAGGYLDILFSNTWHMRELALRQRRQEDAADFMRRLRYLRGRVDNTNPEIRAFDRLTSAPRDADAQGEVKA